MHTGVVGDAVAKVPVTITAKMGHRGLISRVLPFSECDSCLQEQLLLVFSCIV